MQNEQQKMTSTLRQCMQYILDDCRDAGFELSALHIRLAILELDALTQETDANIAKSA